MGNEDCDFKPLLINLGHCSCILRFPILQGEPGAMGLPGLEGFPGVKVSTKVEFAQYSKMCVYLLNIPLTAVCL